MDPWHFLYLRPLPQGQGSFRAGLLLIFAAFSPADDRKEVGWQGQCPAQSGLEGLYLIPHSLSDRV
jgi:hypothetical protein